ncbi:MAG TPA: aminotransferase [Synergistaceae bacterium]|nr:aminotransferase [Synergistaceae bacterium]
MRLDDFTLEKWLNPRDPTAKYNLGASCVKAFHLDEFFELVGGDANEFYERELKGMSLHYGHFFGMDRLLEAVSSLYRDASPRDVLTAHGGTGANHMVISELVEPGDRVVVLMPTYQQHYALPASLGAEVRHLWLRPENDYLPDSGELKRAVGDRTKLVVLANPNNPTGAFIGEPMLREVAGIAEKAGAWVLCDEIYRGLGDGYMPSIVDVSEKGIATSSMSKVFSMAGTRVGWIVTKDRSLRDRLENRRSYDTICCGPFDELLAAMALENSEKVLERSRGLVRSGRRIFEEWMATQPCLSSTEESLSTTAFVAYDYDVPAERLCSDLFEREGVLLCHGGCFQVPKTFRLGYAFGRIDHLREGLRRFGLFLETLE